MSIHFPPTHGVASVARTATDWPRGWVETLAAGAFGPGAVGLVWPAPPSPSEIAESAAASLDWARVGYFDAASVMLPWRSVAENLVLGTQVAPDAELARDMLAIAGLARMAERRPQRLTPFDRLVLGLGRAMLHHPNLLVVPRLAAHPAAREDLRSLARIEDEFGHLTGCLRLHVVKRPADAAYFCDAILRATP